MPGIGRNGDDRFEEIGPTYYFAPPRVLEGLLTSVMIRMEDAGWIKEKDVRLFMAHAGVSARCC